MKYLFLLLMFSSSAFAQYQIDIGKYNLEHAWRGENNHAQFEKQMTVTTTYFYLYPFG